MPDEPPGGTGWLHRKHSIHVVSRTAEPSEQRGFAPQDPHKVALIRQENIRASRGGFGGPVQSLGAYPQYPSAGFTGTSSGGFMGPPPPSQYLNHQIPDVRLPSGRGRTGHHRIGASFASQSLSSSTMGLRAGYTENHAGYFDVKSQRQQMTYALASDHRIMLELQGVTRKPGRVTPEMIGDMYYVVDKVKVNIGTAEIKALAWAQLGPKWVQYSHGYDLCIDCTIHNKDWMEIIPTRSPDVNAIADRFYKPNPKAPNEPIFKTGKFLVYLCIPWSIYSAFLDYDTERQSQEIDNPNCRTECVDPADDAEFIPAVSRTSIPTPKAHFTSGGCLNPASFSARPSHDQDDGKENNVLEIFSKSTGTQKSTFKLDYTSDTTFKTSVPPLSKDALAKALSQQTIPSRQEMGSLMNFTTISVQASIAKQRNLFDLLSSSGKFESFLESPPRDVVLHLNLAPKAQKRGGFKKASFGRS
ncbi:hypothetical protein DFH08DRAFT_1080034 [Mycena albidolilacea]|uniref:Uncharacterized protein n=1 Tax=Mycena albidolilacea TaxID=1033008 RepID=A0AAD7A1J2_9AGAR|nr:hypothetical protein DFH08DRAFT_1080034 [Mycena albidolilacea]